MSIRKDYAKKGQKKKPRSKSRSKSISSAFLKIGVLTFMVIGIAVVYFVKKDLQTLHLQSSSTIAQKAEVSDAEKPKFEFYKRVPIAPKKEKAPATPAYQIQVAALQQKENADRVKAELILTGYAAQIQAVHSKQQSDHRVTVGPYPNLKEAQKGLAELQKQYPDGMIQRINVQARSG